MATLGIKETRDLLAAAGALLVAMKAAFADGVDATDILVLVADPRVREALQAAAEGVTAVPDEVGDIDLREVGTLIQDVLAIIEDVRSA